MDEVKKAYRFLALQYHPDITKGDTLKTEQFRLIKEAYNTLSNADKRKRYDTKNLIANKTNKETSIGSILEETGKLQSYLQHTSFTKINFDNVHFELEHILNPKAMEYLSKYVGSENVDRLAADLHRIAFCLPYKLMEHHHVKIVGLTKSTIIRLMLEQNLQKRKRLMFWGWFKFVIVVLMAIAACIAIASSV